jgi:hypothetical protein
MCDQRLDLDMRSICEDVARSLNLTLLEQLEERGFSTPVWTVGRSAVIAGRLDALEWLEKKMHCDWFEDHEGLCDCLHLDVLKRAKILTERKGRSFPVLALLFAAAYAERREVFAWLHAFDLRKDRDQDIMRDVQRRKRARFAQWLSQEYGIPLTLQNTQILVGSEGLLF